MDTLHDPCPVCERKSLDTPSEFERLAGSLARGPPAPKFLVMVRAQTYTGIYEKNSLFFFRIFYTLRYQATAW